MSGESNGRGAGSRAAREAVLGRIRAATRDVPADESPELDVARAYRTASELSPEEVVELFAERVAEYRATVHRLAAEDVASRIAELAAGRGAHRVALAPGTPEAWRPEGGAGRHAKPLEVAVDGASSQPLAAPALDRFDGVVTGCALAIAETGTIALDGSPLCGRRALTLVPDWHVCVVETAQVVGSVPEGMAALHPAAAAGSPITLISGPSATSDIELRRVEGVHGPRTLDVLLVG